MQSLRMVLACLSMTLVAETTHATSYSWNVASGDWFTATNWSPPTGPPGPADDAVIGNGGTCTLDAAAAVATLTLSSGTLAGTGTLDVSGTTIWSGGAMSGSGVTNANGALTISGVGSKSILAGRTLNSNASATWTDTGNIVYGIGPALGIAVGTTFDVQTDADFTGTGGAAFMTVANAGTFQKSAGAGTTDLGFAVTFNNTGAVDVQTGTLILRGNGTSTGSFDATGAMLTFSSSIGSETHNMSAAASITGSTVTISGSTMNHAGSYNVATTMVSGGTVNLTGPAAALGALTVSGGTLNVSTGSASGAASLTLSNGTLGGSGTLGVSGTLNWTGGSMSGAGITNANGPLSIGGASNKLLLSGRTLNSNAGATWTGTGNIIFGINPALNIAAGTTFDIQNDAILGGSGGAAFMAISNAGTFQKSAGSGTTQIGDVYCAFYNYGTGVVQALSGTLRFDSGAPYDQSAGATRVNGGALTKNGAPMTISGGTLEGAGSLTATVNSSGGTLSPGLSAGQLNQTGGYTQGAGGAFTAEIGGHTAGTDYVRAAISGAAALNGTLNIVLINGFEPNIGDSFTIMTFGSRSGDFSTANGLVIGNGKIFQKTVTATTVVLDVVAAPPTITPTPTVTATPTPTVTATVTNTPTPTLTPTPTETVTPTLTPTSTVTPTVIPLSQFTCYQVGGTKGYAKFVAIPNPPGVSLVDQFGSSTAAVKKPTQLCAPTAKNLEPPPATPDEHLEVYQVKSTPAFTKVLDQVVVDEFGTVHLDLLKPAELMVPTAKDLTMPPSGPLPSPFTGHFQCYKVKDRKIPVKFQPVEVYLLDQFQELRVIAKKPTRLCAPVSKNGEDPSAPSHEDHLMCYQLKDKKQPPFVRVNSAFVENQFGAETLDVKKPAELCLPALVNP